MQAIRLLSFALFALPLAATSVLPVSFDELARDAEAVVSGQIVRLEPELDPSNGYVYTRVTLRVIEAEPALPVGSEYRFRMLGGEWNGRRLRIEGMPEFQAGEEVALFLTARPDNVFGPTVGLWQGVFFVERADGRREVVDASRRPLLGIRGAVRKGRRGLDAGEVSLSNFFEAVRAARSGR